MIHSNRKRRVLFLLLVFLSSALMAQNLKILTEEDPPYSFTGKDGKLDGFAVEVVKEIQSRIGDRNSINAVPWARAYRTIQKEPNVVVFTMSRTAEREDLFQWIGPIVENNWVFIGKKGSGVRISSLAAAKKLSDIGTVRGYAWTQYLKSKGFYNLDEVAKRSVNVKKLQRGRIDAFVSADSSYKSAIRENGLNVNNYEILYTFSTVQMYIAHSKGTSKTITRRWQKALDDMKRDGSFQRLHKKWLPENNLPGKAKVAK